MKSILKRSALLFILVFVLLGCSALAGEDKPSAYVRAQATCLNVLGYDHSLFEACVLDQMDYERTQDRLDQAERRERWQAIAGATAAALKSYGQPHAPSPGYRALPTRIVVEPSPMPAFKPIQSPYHTYMGPNGGMVTCHTTGSFTDCF